MSINTSILSALEVREFLSDYPAENLLLDREEFSDTFIQLCMDLAAEEFNALPPGGSNYTSATFPSKATLLVGTCWKMFAGRCAVLARNHMNYSDGGLQIPIEERYNLYKDMADTYRGQFMESATKLKISQNMSDGWGSVYGDQAFFPWW